MKEIFNLKAIETLPLKANEGDIIRIKNNKNLHDGYYVFNGHTWMSWLTW